MTMEFRCMFPDCNKKIRPDLVDGKEEVCVSHGICDECLEKHYPAEADELLERSEDDESVCCSQDCRKSQG